MDSPFQFSSFSIPFIGNLPSLSFGNLSVSSLYSNFTPGVTRGYGSLSVWLVDSAVRWRCNGAVGLRKIVVRLRLFDRRFLSFCGFAIRRVARAAVFRCGSSPLRLSPGSPPLHRLRSERAYVVSSQALLRSVLCCFRAEACGASVCEPPQGGASARTAKAGDSRFGPLPADRQRFLFPKSVAASCTFQSAAELANNSVVCHSEEQSDEESVC